jgi:hypothetical protein
MLVPLPLASSISDLWILFVDGRLSFSSPSTNPAKTLTGTGHSSSSPILREQDSPPQNSKINKKMSQELSKAETQEIFRKLRQKRENKARFNSN